jgi:hypothetical protein
LEGLALIEEEKSFKYPIKILQIVKPLTALIQYSQCIFQTSDLQKIVFIFQNPTDSGILIIPIKASDIHKYAVIIKQYIQ